MSGSEEKLAILIHAGGDLFVWIGLEGPVRNIGGIVECEAEFCGDQRERASGVGADFLDGEGARGAIVVDFGRGRLGDSGRGLVVPGGLLVVSDPEVVTAVC